MSKNQNVMRWGLIGATVLIALYLLTLIGDDTRAFQDVDTSVALQQLEDDNAEKVQIDDREQRVRIELREPITVCLLYTSPSPRDLSTSRMPSSA